MNGRKIAKFPLCDNKNRISDCLKETCRQCKKDNHIPQRCEEVENDEELKNRKILEEKMSEAMIRQCYNCKTPYFKTQGCNHMTCPKCKKEMCYICKRPYRECKKDNKCFSYGGTSDQLHVQEVKEAAEKAKKELGGKAKLKYDPTKNLPSTSTSADIRREYTSDESGLSGDSDLDSSDSSDSEGDDY